jgi:hypothetical protein
MPEKQPEFIEVELGKIKAWGQNPRRISPENLQALKRSVEKYGLFQTLTVWKEGDDFVTGGGNMRYKVMTEVLKWPADKKIHVCLNFPSNQAERLELSFLDNQTFGFYNELEVAELVKPVESELDMALLQVSFENPMPLRMVLDSFKAEEPLPVEDVSGDKTDQIPNRFPIEPKFMVVGIGAYIGVVDRETAEPAIDLLQRKFGDTQEGRKMAYEMVCALVRDKLQPELGPPREMTPMGRGLQKERTARRQAVKDAERKEREEAVEKRRK